MSCTYVEDVLGLEQWSLNQGNAAHRGRSVNSKDSHRLAKPPKRETPAMRRLRKPFSWRYQAVDVIVEDKHHENNEKEQPDLLGQLSLLDA